MTKFAMIAILALSPKAMDAEPAFEVASIKPSSPASQGMIVKYGESRQFKALNASLRDLVVIAMGVQPQQITGAPIWFSSERFDILAVSPGEGKPNAQEHLAMLRDLLENRFAMMVHREQRTVSVYALKLGGTPPKLTPNKTASEGPPSFHGQGMGHMEFQNTSLKDLATLLGRRLDRPVVDQTALSGRFDFRLDWAPDELEYEAMHIRLPRLSQTEDKPRLAIAMREQLRLRIEAMRAPAEVVVIDHVEHPSGN